MKYITLLLFLLIENVVVNAKGVIEKNDVWYAPDYVKIQYAGNIGFLSIGVGYSILNDHLQSGIFYGYVPKFVGGIDIHTIAGKITCVPYYKELSGGFVLSSIYFGLGINFGLSSDLFLFLPDRYSDNYYPPTALYFTGYLGTKIHRNSDILNGTFKGYDIYLEVGTIDYYITAAFKSKDISFFKILNLAIGIAFYF